MKQEFKIQKRQREIAVRVKLALKAVFLVILIFSGAIADKLLAVTELDSVYSLAKDQPLAIYYPYTGNSGCTLIRCESAVVMIDCGQNMAQFDIDSLLQNTGITKIDLAILTHPDADHFNAFASAMETVPIGKFITCEYSLQDDSADFSILKRVLKDHSAPLETARAGDTYTVGSLRLDILSPESIYKNSNNNSLVTRMTYGEFTALFIGDAASRVEKDILSSGINISADVLTVSHHGSAGATSEEFIRAVSPKYAVIMTSESRYLPSGETIARLSDFGCEIYRTDVSETIAVCSDGTASGIKIFADKQKSFPH